GIGKTTLEKIDQIRFESSQAGEGLSYWDVLMRAAREPALTSSATSKKLSRFVELLERLRKEQNALLLSELFHLILDQTGYVQELRQEGTEEALARIENLEELDSLLQEFEEDELEGVSESELPGKRAQLLERFIEQSSLASDVDQMDSVASSVKLMTLHSSKGLEFPVVFLVGMEEGLFPSVKAWEEATEEDVEEERRLCYVGMTRARHQLYLLNAVIRRIWGQVSYQEPSRFFHEISDEYVELRDFSVGSRAGTFRTGSSRHLGYGGYSSQAGAAGGGERTFSSATRASTTSGSTAGDSCIGRQILHPEYGPGVVVSSEGAGADQKVMIRFSGRDERKFLLRYVASYFDES
ncbi:MAG: ATP-binding domain-containing protein, partial [Bdellovibrio sp.]|nr:ATP-binding domain-containing protein [Bdellovibrio sp.]